MFRKLLFPIIFILVFFCAGISVMADEDPADAGASTGAPVIEDSSNEMLFFDDIPGSEDRVRPGTGGDALLQGSSSGITNGAVYKEGYFLSSSAFIKDKGKSSYIDRMIKYYIDNNANLKEALADGKAVVMFFEGASDIAGKVSDGYRNAAVCLVIKQNLKNHRNYIAYYDKNSTTYPDYPYAYDYVNGHDGYGTAVALDGIYNIYTHNHNSYYAAFNVRTGNKNAVPCIYMNNKGSFSVLNGTGINLHLRPYDTVSGDELKPTSAGCLLIGGTDSVDSFNNFLNTVDPDNTNREQTTIQGITLDKYTTTGSFAGCVVIDRYLGKDILYEVYKNKEAIETITAFSTFSQNVQAAGPTFKTAGLESYSSYMTGTVSGGKALYSLPCKGRPAAKTRSGSLLINGVFKNCAGELYYRVFTGNATYYISAADVKKVSPKFDDITIHNYNYPEVKAQGKSFSIKGIVARQYNTLTSVTGSVLTSGGTVNNFYTVKNILSSVAISNEDGWVDLTNDAERYINNQLKFSGLATGTYTYRITADVKNHYVDRGQIKCFEKEIILVDKTFEVLPLITFEAGDGTVNGGETATLFTDKSGKINNLPVAVLEGNNFDGWFTEGGEKVTSNTVFTASTSLTAKYSEIVPKPEKEDYEKKQPGKEYPKTVKKYSPVTNLFHLASWYKKFVFWWI